MLEIKNLFVEGDEGKKIINGLNLNIGEGEFHVLMGPNGSGKTTLAKVIAGYPKVKVTGGEMLMESKSLLQLKPNERAKLGIFLQFQEPVEVEGVKFVSFLHAAKSAIGGKAQNTKEFMADLTNAADKLKISGLRTRSLNQGLSGGEKKKAEIIQLMLLKPKLAILDEPDSGLDIDAVKLVAEAINEVAKQNKMAILLITHYSRILNYMKPDYVHVMMSGKIIKEGGEDLVRELERTGYSEFKEEKEE